MAKKRGEREIEKKIVFKDDAPHPIFTPRRDVALETHAVTTGASSALSSKKMLYYHDIPPELLRRVGLRCTGGHVKYNDKPIPITMNLNWRVGLSDPLYMMDRLNHLFEHLICFLEDGNEKDDNLGAIALMAGWLMECEKNCPEVFKQLYGQQRFFGRAAEDKKKMLQEGK